MSHLIVRCDVCDTPIDTSQGIEMAPYPDYQTIVSIRGLDNSISKPSRASKSISNSTNSNISNSTNNNESSNSNNNESSIQNVQLPEHLTDMHLMALAPVVRCPSCGAEDPPCSQKIFENLAHIKAFNAMPDGRFLLKLRNHFGASRGWLASKIGYDAIQSIYRFENKLLPIPKYAQMAMINIFLYRNDLENEYGNWNYNPRDWDIDSIEIMPNNTFLVPLPSRRIFKADGYSERKYKAEVLNNPNFNNIA